MPRVIEGRPHEGTVTTLEMVDDGTWTVNTSRYGFVLPGTKVRESVSSLAVAWNSRSNVAFESWEIFNWDETQWVSVPWDDLPPDDRYLIIKAYLKRWPDWVGRDVLPWEKDDPIVTLVTLGSL